MANIDERLERRLQRIARPVVGPAFEVLDRRRRRRQRRRVVGAGILAATVVAGSIGAFAIARATFGDARPEDPMPVDIAPVDPGPSVEDLPGADIGLDFRLCGLQRLAGIDFFGDGTRGIAWTGAPLEEGRRCPSARDVHVVAVDHDGDGSADSFTYLPICTGCRPYEATDLGGDGTAELVVLLQLGSTPEYGIFDVVPEGLPRSAGVVPIFVQPPGARRAGYPSNQPVSLWAGGDEGFSAAIRCEGYPEATELVAAWSVYSVAEAESDPNAVEEFHQTRLRLEEPDASSASFIVLETSSGERPVGEGAPFEQPPRACGVDWAP